MPTTDIENLFVENLFIYFKRKKFDSFKFSIVEL